MSGTAANVAEILRAMDLGDRVVLPGGEVILARDAHRRRGHGLTFLVSIGGETRTYGHVDKAAAALAARRHT
jgi:hypothetical protein